LKSSVLSTLYSENDAASTCTDPVWFPDSHRVLYSINHRWLQTEGRHEIYAIRTDSDQPELLFSTKQKWISAEDISPDGGFAALVGPGEKVASLLPLNGDHTPREILSGPYQKNQFRFSPDGRWLAYDSDETGRWEVYMTSFPSLKHKRQVSNTGGGQPHWRRDRQELLYLALNGKIMSVRVNVGGELETSVPLELFQSPLVSGDVDPTSKQFDVTGDGQKFLVPEVTEFRDPINLVFNWLPIVRQ